ncbi:hypothetical protein ZIOFF_014347 [Zingiber officinale]|uniref:Uncharacterized protein n=1 Tax=Zingiber officinale TaxID=94328 RepID=A0A8J5HCV8_ZINOF|nr:hypothetical protein ZIOFF_014347 [Zingiber officinale]
MSLKCAAELGIADVIHPHGQPLPLSVLLTKLCILPSRTDSFRCLMRLLVHSGLFTSSTARDEEEEAYALTPISASRGSPPPPNHPPPSTSSTGSVFELTGDNPEFNVNFNLGMTADSSFMAKLILKQYGDDVFRGLRSLVDVGGGIGALATAIANAFPQTKCAVFDLPHVVSSLQGNPSVAAIAGNMFEFVSPADAWILHDWNDEDCVMILKNCKKAIPPKEEGGKVIIIEMVTQLENEEDGSNHDETTETQLLLDVYVRAVYQGRRGAKQNGKVSL